MSDERMCYSCIENTERKGWGAGQWDDEPNRVEFEHAGLPCILHRGGMGAWCGYAGVSPGHPYHRVDYSEVDSNIEVHGGLTYSAPCNGGHICHIAKPGEPDDVWWFGFDCNHSGDFAPKMGEALEYFGTYKSMAYARRETERLAEQLVSANGHHRKNGK